MRPRAARDASLTETSVEGVSSENEMSSTIQTVVPENRNNDQVALSNPTLDMNEDSNMLVDPFLESNVDMSFESHLQGGFQMLFDSTNDTQGLSQELDWLFGTLSPDQDGIHDLYANTGEMVWVPPFSPSSTLSHQSSINATSGLDTVWHDVREKILLCLHPLSVEIMESSFFDPANLEKFYHIYFNNYNTHFPILHQYSFSCRDSSPLLMLAILTLGATLSEKEHFETSEAIHDRLRWLIFSVRTSHLPPGTHADYNSQMDSNHQHRFGVCKPYSSYKLMKRCSHHENTTKWPTYFTAPS